RPAIRAPTMIIEVLVDHLAGRAEQVHEFGREVIRRARCGGGVHLRSLFSECTLPARSGSCAFPRYPCLRAGAPPSAQLAANLPASWPGTLIPASGNAKTAPVMQAGF